MTFLWGYLQDKVFSTPPCEINELHQRIVDKFNVLQEHPALINRAVRDMHRQTMLCIERNGDHVKGRYA